MIAVQSAMLWSQMAESYILQVSMDIRLDTVYRLEFRNGGERDRGVSGTGEIPC